MKLNSESMKRIAILSLVVLGVQMLLTKVYSYFGYTTSQLFGIIPYVPNAQTALGSTTVGDKLIGYLMGIYPFDLGNFTSWIAMFVGAFILIALGYSVYDKIKIFKARNETQVIWAVLAYGTVILYGFLLVTKMATVATIAVPLLIGLALNYFILAVVVSKIAEMFPIVRI